MSNNKSPEVQLKELLEATLSKTQAFSETIEALASEKATYTDRMCKMENHLSEAMKKMLDMDASIKDFHKHMNGKLSDLENKYKKQVGDHEAEGEAEGSDGSDNEIINKPKLPKANETDPDKLPKSEPSDAELTHEKLPAETDEEVINSPKAPKALMKDKENEKELEKQEEKVHVDLDGDKEEGEPAEHKKKVLGKKAEAEANEIGGVNEKLNTVEKGVTMNKTGKPQKKGVSKVVEDEDGDVEVDEPVNEKYDEEKKKGKKASTEDIASILDAKIEAALTKFAQVNSAKKTAQVDPIQEALALETKAKEDAINQFKALNEKFESLMNKVNGLEKQELVVEKKVAQVVAKQASPAIPMGVDKPEAKESTDEDAFKRFEALSGKEQRAFYLANKAKIERHASALLRQSRS